MQRVKRLAQDEGIDVGQSSVDEQMRQKHFQPITEIVGILHKYMRDYVGM